MELKVKQRKVEKKSNVKQLRRDGFIPAVMYAKGTQAQSIELARADFEAALRQIQPNHLSNTVFTLKEDKTEKKAIVKDIQYHRTTYDVLHLDFEILDDKTPVKVKIPVEYKGAEECQGVKIGGFLRSVIRQVPVKCLPSQIPQEFQIDVRRLGIKQSKRLKDIEFPEGVKPLAKLNEVVVIVAKR